MYTMSASDRLSHPYRIAPSRAVCTDVYGLSLTNEIAEFGWFDTHLSSSPALSAKSRMLALSSNAMVSPLCPFCARLLTSWARGVTDIQAQTDSLCVNHR